MEPSSRSSGFVVVTVGVCAVAAEAFPCPAAASTACVAATPLHSDTLALTMSGADRCAVTAATGAAPVACQISIRVFDPERNPMGPFVHALPAESVTEVTDVVAPAAPRTPGRTRGRRPRGS